ncbi:MAG: hypothetical protein M3115_00470 [Thermoproteota archaeon]|nr:hypothetical protein [Thermoproteota archaeon]
MQLCTDFFSSTLKGISTSSVATKVLIVVLYLAILGTIGLNNDGIAYAQQAQGNGRTADTMNGTSSAGTFKISLDVEPFPIEADMQTMFNITFIRLAEPAVLQINVGYDIFILDENNNIIFRASNTTSQGEDDDDDFLFSANGTVNFPYSFESAGNYTMHIKVLRVNFIPIQPEFVAFPITVSHSRI